jgi:hypothetical protein
LLLSADLAYIFLHVANELLPFVRHDLLDLGKDKGHPEFFQYVKFLWILILLSYTCLKRRSVHYISWVLVFVYFLLDDAMRIHEQVGGQIAGSLDFTPILGLRRQDVGELVLSAFAGTILLAILMWAYAAGSQAFRKLSQDLALLIIILAIFGVIFDMAHSAIKPGESVTFILGVIEDGGEMLAVSLIVWRVFLMNIRGDGGCYLGDVVRLCVARRRR